MSDMREHQAVAFEHCFWLQILGDHSRMILAALSPEEKVEIDHARYFIDRFDRLLLDARELPGDGHMLALTENALRQAKYLRQFKLHLLRRHLTEQIGLGLPPTFINHMVNELEEYLRILDCISAEGQVPCYHVLHHHLLWLLDGVGHVGAITCNLDAVEAELRAQSENFKQHFDGLYKKAQEMKGYLRTGLKEFPALTRLNQEASAHMHCFMEFLTVLRDDRLTKQALGTLQPLVPDHMYREECYYVTKLTQALGVEMPNCDATKPRLEC